MCRFYAAAGVATINPPYGAHLQGFTAQQGSVCQEHRSGLSYNTVGEVERVRHIHGAGRHKWNNWFCLGKEEVERAAWKRGHLSWVLRGERDLQGRQVGDGGTGMF